MRTINCLFFIIKINVCLYTVQKNCIDPAVCVAVRFVMQFLEQHTKKENL